MYTEGQHLDVFREPHYMKTVPVSARDLILGVLTKDPAQRLTIEQVTTSDNLKTSIFLRP
jgi:hypothetical protein